MIAERHRRGHVVGGNARSAAVGEARRIVWLGGWPLRSFLVLLVRLYRLTLGQVIGGNCRFYPSCSAYAEEAIREAGAVRGLVLTAWRILRCSPLSAGGVDHPPTRRLYDVDIQSRKRAA